MVPANRDRTLSREISVTQIPSGDKHTLPAGTKIQIHQTLGGSYTVQTDHGLFRIDGKDGDALGEKVADHTVEAATLADGAPNPEALWDQLRRVYDPEIPVNIVDLGLIYKVVLTPDPNSKRAFPRQRVEVEITMTSQGCPSHVMIMEQVRNRLAGIPEVSDAQVNLVWEPAWTPDRISQKAREQLGIG
jgi:probable FeS assembly SUF system protein SufT